jgi:hypothetical protein
MESDTRNGSRAAPGRNLISRKKPIYRVSGFLAEYLTRYDRLDEEGVRYEDLLRFENEIALFDEQGNDTLWSTVFYGPPSSRRSTTPSASPTPC